MSEQLDLMLTRGYPPFAKGSATSMAAANRIEPHVSPLQARVLEYIVDQGAFGATDEQIAFVLQLNPSTARPRRIELVELGKIKQSGTRKGRSGRQMCVWVSA